MTGWVCPSRGSSLHPADGASLPRSTFSPLASTGVPRTVTHNTEKHPLTMYNKDMPKTYLVDRDPGDEQPEYTHHPDCPQHPYCCCNPHLIDEILDEIFQKEQDDA